MAILKKKHQISLSIKNIKNLMSSASKTAPLLQLILDEDSEEELEQILDAHLRFKQQCEAYKSTCHLKVNVTTDEREQVNSVHTST
jgi:hypothetical protein